MIDFNTCGGYWAFQMEPFETCATRKRNICLPACKTPLNITHDIVICLSLRLMNCDGVGWNNGILFYAKDGFI